MNYLKPTATKICKLCAIELFRIQGSKIGYMCGKCGGQYTIERPYKPTAETTNTSGKAHCPYCGICHTREETCREAKARVASIRSPSALLKP